MGTSSVLISLLLFGFSQSLNSRKCSLSSEYRELNGKCSSSEDPNWGASGKILSMLDTTALRVSSSLPSRIIADQPEVQDPVTEWLGAWTSFIKSDLFNLGQDYRGLINVASGVLDLSNLYGTSGDTVNIDPRLIGENWDVSEKVLWKLLESEHYRLSEQLSILNPSWSINQIHQEARKILIAEYESIVINEVVPLLIGSRADSLRKAAMMNVTEEISASDLVLGVHVDLGLSSSELNYLEMDPLEQTWRELAVRMNEINLIIPDTGVTMDKLNELSDVRDILQNLYMPSYQQFRSECGIDNHIKRGESSGLDVLMGGLMEVTEDGAVLSPTLACAFEKVLRKVISGDRFWYSKSSSGFTPDQISNLDSMKLSSLMCANLPYIKSIQPNSFLDEDTGLNSEVLCDNLPELDLYLWINEDSELDLSEDEEIAEAIAAANNRLLEFRRYEYDLFQDNFISANGNGQSAHSAVARPNIPVQNALNASILFELVTYEFLRRPKLSLMIYDASSPRRIKRQADREQRGISNRVFQVTPIKLAINNRIETSRGKSPQEKIYYKSVSTKTVSGSNVHVQSIEGPGRLTFDVSTRDAVGEGKCDPREREADCSEFDRYRSYSGWCNNKNHKEWGAANSIHKRLLPSEYDDRISSPRTTSVRGSKLPSPRLVSLKVHNAEERLDPKYTLMLMQWGQFIDHDLTHTPMLRGFHNTILECGDCKSKNVHPACFPIRIPEEDNFYAFNRRDPKCIPFARSSFGQQTLGPREQMNQLTSYLDASMVYGSNECEMRHLRETGTYLLKMFTHPLNTHNKRYKSLLPRTRENSDCFSTSGECFMAGDARVNEQPGLTCLHTVFVREHNKIAEELAGINSHWDVNKVFEETRRIISAQVQHITFNEFLPRVLGLNSLTLFDVDLRTSDYYYDYDESCSATSFTEFSTAAFRFGHSMISPNITMMNERAMQGRSIPRSIPLRQVFNRPDMLMEANMIDDLLRGLTMMPMETLDSSVTEEVTNHLFETTRPKSGMDLVALNIQRGRDHGIPGYNKYREVCQLTRANTFLDLKNEIRGEIISKLIKTYNHPDDIDLFTGLLAEKRLPGALTGPTLACIIGLQFKHLRKCDRYWYETSDPKIRFSEQQLQELRTSNLAALICKNMEQNSKISRSSMDQMDRLTNPLVDCDRTIRSLNLEAWRETPPSASPVRTSSSSHIITKGEDGGYSESTTVCQIGNQSVKRGNLYRISPCTTCTCTAQGVKCETIDLSDFKLSCIDLVRQFGLKKVEQDDSCKPQCRII